MLSHLCATTVLVFYRYLGCGCSRVSRLELR